MIFINKNKCCIREKTVHMIQSCIIDTSYHKLVCKLTFKSASGFFKLNNSFKWGKYNG